MVKGLYIHLPFCRSICPYCDFVKRVSNKEIQFSYLKSLLVELEIRKEEIQHVETIYIGGGTPTSFLYLKELFEGIQKSVNIEQVKEYSIESTPLDALNYLSIYHHYGINRFSLGVESFDPKILSYCQRKKNSFRDVKEIICELRNEGINNINLDLIYSLPYSSLKTVKYDLKCLKKLNPTHVSYYDLIIEDGTILKHELDKKSISLPCEDVSVSMRDMIEKKLEEDGFTQYEISSWAKPGFESIHNKEYWLLEDYIGIGLGAHSKVNNTRSYNTKNMKTYATIKNKDSYYAQVQKEASNPMGEFFMMGLRMNKGVSLLEFQKKYNLDPLNKYPIIKTQLKEDLVEIKDDYLRLTKKGRHLGNIVFEDFV